MMDHFVLPAARDELEAAILHYERDRPGRGIRFGRAFDAAIRGILAFPLASALIDGGVRCCKIKRFPYGIFYRVDDSVLVVVAVIHLHRGPAYWKRRLGE